MSDKDPSAFVFVDGYDVGCISHYISTQRCYLSWRCIREENHGCCTSKLENALLCMDRSFSLTLRQSVIRCSPAGKHRSVF